MNRFRSKTLHSSLGPCKAQLELSASTLQPVYTAACLLEVCRPLPANRVQPTPPAYQQPAALCPDPSEGTSQGLGGGGVPWACPPTCCIPGWLNNDQGEPREKPHHAQYATPWSSTTPVAHSSTRENGGHKRGPAPEGCKEQKHQGQVEPAGLHLSRGTEATELLQGT